MKIATLKKKWTGESGTGGIGTVKPTDYCLRIEDYGGNGACGSGTLVTAVFPNAQSALASLKFTYIPFILAFDAAPDVQGSPKLAEEYLPLYRGKKKAELTALLKLMDVSMVKAAIDSKTMKAIIRKYNHAFYDTNPESLIHVHGLAPDFLYSAEMQEEILGKLQDGDHEELQALGKLFKTRTFDFKNKTHSHMLFQLLEGMNQF